jgi:signal transduction histidine kinase
LWRAWRRDVVGCAVLAGCYYGSARLGYALDFSGTVAAIVWLPVGVAIAYLYVRGLRFWPGVVVGDLLANYHSALPFGLAWGQTVGNVLEVVLGAYLLRRLSRRFDLLSSPDTVLYVLFPLAAATALSASVGCLSLWLGGVVKASSLPDVWRTWWLGDSCGALLVVPLVLAWTQPLRHAVTWRRAAEGMLVLAAAAAVAEEAAHTTRPLVYLIFPPLIWAALRFGQRGATLAAVLAATITIWNTTHFIGPFYADGITGVLSTQLFIAVATLSALGLAAVVAERERYAERLRESRKALVQAADAERHRIERNLHDGAQQRLILLALNLRHAVERAVVAPEETAALLEKAQADLEIALDEMRQLAHGLHPFVLTEAGLAAAIRGLAHQSPIPAELVDLPSERFDLSTEAAAYYLVAEALANAQKHSGATSIQIRAHTLNDGMLQLEVTDNGRGGAREDPGGGLNGLRQRIEALGGTFHLYSNHGTQITAQIPQAVARTPGRRKQLPRT